MMRKETSGSSTTSSVIVPKPNIAQQIRVEALHAAVNSISDDVSAIAVIARAKNFEDYILNGKEE